MKFATPILIAMAILVAAPSYAVQSETCFRGGSASRS